MEATPAQPERRSALRRRLALPVSFPGGTGVTRDVSAGGLYLLSERSLEEGKLLTLRITLDHADPRRPVYMDCRGRVTRAERLPNGAGGGARGEDVWGTAFAVECFGFGDERVTPRMLSGRAVANGREEA